MHSQSPFESKKKADQTTKKIEKKRKNLPKRFTKRKEYFACSATNNFKFAPDLYRKPAKINKEQLSLTEKFRLRPN